MAGSRTWITREEIAEIHESIAQRNLFTECALDHLERAEDIRFTERLSMPVGRRMP